MRGRYSLTALVEPSATVREELGARYGIPGLYADYRSLLDAGDLDAIVICSPAGTHAEVVLAAPEDLADSRERPPLAHGQALWIEPLPPHSVENIGSAELHIIAIEMKQS